jgi:hypothetical protein
MTPEEITKHFGADALNMLYDCIMQNPVHDLANWLLSLYTEQQIAEWIMTLKQDQLDEGESE